MCTCMSLETLINYSHIHEHYLHIYYIFAYALFGYLLKRAKNQANSSIEVVIWDVWHKSCRQNNKFIQKNLNILSKTENAITRSSLEVFPLKVSKSLIV